jgi:hypothetical protein
VRDLLADPPATRYNETSDVLRTPHLPP